MKISEWVDQVKRAPTALCDLYRRTRDWATAKWPELDRRSKIGAAVTAAWLLFFGMVALFHIPAAALTSAELMGPNEWGDFLAGVFAPLAFFWLVLGYYQQGEELRQNTRALELQQQEMKAAADATAQLAASALADHQLQRKILEGQNRIKFAAEFDYSRSNIPRDAGLLSGRDTTTGNSIILRSIAAAPKNLQVSSSKGLVWLTTIRDGEYRLEAVPPWDLASLKAEGGLPDHYTPEFPIPLEITYLNNINEEKIVLAHWDSLWSIDFGGENEKHQLE